MYSDKSTSNILSKILSESPKDLCQIMFFHPTPRDKICEAPAPSSAQAAVSEALPGPEESIGEQDVISTTDHAEVARALPAEVQCLGAKTGCISVLWYSMAVFMGENN